MIAVPSVVDTLHAAGLTVTLLPDSRVYVTPAARITDELRGLIRANLQDLRGWLQAANDPGVADPGDWRVLAKAYHAHHFACPTCIAAGQGRGLRCGVGASLWAVYQKPAIGRSTR